eukprot:5948126-Prorocentrum_lima.AAC.1
MSRTANGSRGTCSRTAHSCPAPDSVPPMRHANGTPWKLPTELQHAPVCTAANAICRHTAEVAGRCMPTA